MDVFSGSQTAIFFHFNGIIFSCCYKGTIVIGEKKIKIETLRINPWVTSGKSNVK